MDSSSFAGSKDPFGGVALDPSRDFFQPLGVQNPTTSFSAPPQLKPPVAPAPSDGAGGMASFCRRNVGVIAGVSLVVALCIAGYMVYHARIKAMLIKGPFEADIAKVSDAERRSDLHELHYLWRISRRSAVKQMLGDTLQSALGGPTETVSSAPPPQESQSAAAGEDPFFTAA